MNKRRREELLFAKGMLETALNIVSKATDAEEDSLDNTPENLQGSDMYDKKERAVDFLNDASSNIEDAVENIENAIV